MYYLQFDDLMVSQMAQEIEKKYDDPYFLKRQCVKNGYLHFKIYQ